MRAPCPQALIEQVPRRQPVIAFRLQQIEHKTTEGLVGAHDERTGWHLDVAPFEPAGHRRRAVTLKDLIGVTHLGNHELLHGHP